MHDITGRVAEKQFLQRPPFTGTQYDQIIVVGMGMVTSYTMGGLIHILLVVAIIVVLIRVIQGRRVL
jgi:hypothetical protein